MNVNSLQETIRTQERPTEEIELIMRAYDFAFAAHKGQKRKSGAPYIIHPLATAERLAEMRIDSPTVAAALLHDVCEDTRHSINEIRERFGEEIAFLVEGVTKLDKLRYHGAARSAESLRKMFLAIGEDIRIVLLKLVDRLHNMETLQFLPPEKQKRIALETIEIYAPLAYRLGLGELKGRLEDLAFPYVYPEEYKRLLQTIESHFSERQSYIERLKPIVAKKLAREGIRFVDIHARAKHYYSLYKKLQKYDTDISQIHDLIALRIIVRDTEQCYAALGAIHKLWKPIPGLIKDYIALPKPNGYRSLHTTVFGHEERMVEFQIRTEAMHHEAENGIAAHWAYSESKGSDQDKKGVISFAALGELQWIQQLREWQKDFENPDEFLEALKIDFFKNRIFVLTPKGDVIDLPDGSTPIDFAYHIHSDIGNTAVGARVNNRIVPLDYQLKNGEVVHILTQKNKKPSADWLQFVRSAHARTKIASVLHRTNETRHFSERRNPLVEFSVNARDRIGLLRDISHTFASLRINIKSSITHPVQNTHAHFTVQAIIKNRNQLNQLIAKLKEVKNVKEMQHRLL